MRSRLRRIDFIPSIKFTPIRFFILKSDKHKLQIKLQYFNEYRRYDLFIFGHETIQECIIPKNYETKEKN